MVPEQTRIPNSDATPETPDWHNKLKEFEVELEEYNNVCFH